MPLYEHVYLARQDVSAQQVEDLTKQFTGRHRRAGRQGHQERILGREVAELTASARTARRTSRCSTSMRRPRRSTEVERQERINEDVLRYLTIRVDELEEGPSAMMRKVERDRERDERGDGAATAWRPRRRGDRSAATVATGRRA